MEGSATTYANLLLVENVQCQDQFVGQSMKYIEWTMENTIDKTDMDREETQHIVPMSERSMTNKKAGQDNILQSIRFKTESHIHSQLFTARSLEL